MQPSSNNTNRANIRRLAFAAVVLCVVIVGVFIYQSLTFHIVGTIPSMDKFPVSSPVIFIDFNKPLANTTLTTSWNPGLGSAYTISGTRLTIYLQAALQTGKQYTFTIHGVTSQAGEKLGDVTYTFTPQNIDYGSLPKEIQQVLFSNQDQNQLPSRDTITFSGTTGLINQGISTYQIEALKQAVFLFGQKTNTTVTTAVVDDSTITIPPYGTNTAPDYFTMSFDMTINTTRYHATLQYSDVASMQLLLSQNNNQVYDSGTIDGSTL